LKKAIDTGLSFGLTSGVITTLGLIVGLHSGTHSEQAIIGGILTIAIADAMSDALGIHISKESDVDASKSDVWIATITTLISKMIMALSFVAPVLMLDLFTAIIVSAIWGLLVLTVLSYLLAKKQNESPWPVIAEHLSIAVAVIAATHFIGEWVALYFS
jgi:VIT1/CCC1 family predicted Fe2+/Mn2+ transporter